MLPTPVEVPIEKKVWSNIVGWEWDFCILGIKNAFVEIILDVGSAGQGPPSSRTRTFSAPVLAGMAIKCVIIHRDCCPKASLNSPLSEGDALDYSTLETSSPAHASSGLHNTTDV